MLLSGLQPTNIIKKQATFATKGGHSPLKRVISPLPAVSGVSGLGFVATFATDNYYNLKKMDKATIETKVIDIIANKLGLPKEEVTPAANFTMDLGADSLDTVELIMDFEKEFGLKISDEDAMGIKTVSDAIEYIAAHN